jgi:hypothetical protein
MRSVVSFILTPEAIAEILVETFNEKYGEVVTRHYLSLVQNELYYLILIDERECRSLLENICLDTIRRYGIYGRESVVLVAHKEKSYGVGIVFPKQYLRYFQIKNKVMEKVIMTALETVLPKKLLKKEYIEFIYQSDLSDNWNYHEKTEKPLLHIKFVGDINQQGEKQIVQSCYQLSKMRQ